MSVSPTPSPRSAIVSGRYRMIRKLGSGSLGTVFLARDERDGRTVALKVLHSERLGAEAMEQIQKEFRSFASLHHPQIAAAYDFGYTDAGGVPYYAREYIEGSPLAPGPLRPEESADPRKFLAPFFDLLDALGYLHAQEILHLDIHAGNLIVAAEPSRGAVLIDFGLGRLVRGGGSPALILPCGSLPPEIFGDGDLGPSTDLYSVGRLLLFRLTGRDGVPFDLPREIPGWSPRVAIEIERAIAKAVQKNPRDRFQTAAQFRDALSSATGGARSPLAAEPGDLTIGREAEVEAIEDCLRKGARGAPAALWLVGPPGMGKSRLLEEARLRAQIRGLDVVAVKCIEEASAEPILSGALRGWGWGRGETGWLAPLAVEHGGSSAERSLRAAAAYFDEDGPPIVILIDDIEHADTDTRMLAEALLSECLERDATGTAGRAMVLIGASVHAPDASTSEARRFVHRLRSLPRKDARQLLAKLLRPLTASGATLSRLTGVAGGSPLRLRKIARALHAEFDRAGLIPAGARAPQYILEGEAPEPPPEIRENPVHRQVLLAIAVIGRPAGRDEIGAAAKLPPGIVEGTLRLLTGEEVLSRRRKGGRSQYAFAHPLTRDDLLCRMPSAEIRATHGRVAEHLARMPDRDPGTFENLARHLLAAGRRGEGRKAALDAAASLRGRGLLHAGVRLILEALGGETDGKWRIRFIEEVSDLCEEAGDHREAVALLEPVHRGDLGPLPADADVRIRRRLGVHHHRTGAADRALALFREVRDRADPLRHVGDLVIVESELAELHTLRGEYGEAEEACRRGLRLLAGARGLGREFRARMEVMLRASHGHLELRRMETECARRDLETALRLARSFGTTTARALILNNLGIAYNQANDFVRARRSYRSAERLLERAGERRAVIHTACNLATIAAKTGDVAGAREHLERASHLLARHPGKKLDFMVEIARGLVSHSLGDMVSAVRSFETAIPLGRELGDVQYTGFATIYLGEAFACCGRHGEALEILRGLIGRQGGARAVLDRAARCRLLALEELLGDARAARELRDDLEKSPRTPMAFLEAWNDIFLSLGGGLPSEPPEGLLRRACEEMAGIGVPAGTRCARVGLLEAAMRRGDAGALRSRMEAVEETRDDRHRLLAVLEPLVLGEASFALGDADRAEAHLREASCAIVGQPFLEMDWRIELLAARVATRGGDREAARRCLQRSLQTRDLLARSLPARSRSRFLAHPRFAPLADLAARLERPSFTPLVRGRDREGGEYHGIVGTSPAMRGIFETIERLRDREIPVLIAGETGTGKELVARAIHETGPRRRGPFLALHCASLPEELFEAELFGYEAGAFTGAEESRQGLLQHLAGGTLFLDDVSSLSPGSQVKLLRVLESGAVRPLGGSAVRPIDLRFLSSSSCDLDGLVERGQFRGDLYFRLRGIEVRLPPLRARREDIHLLAAHLIALHSKRLRRPAPVLKADALALLEKHDWPGNVRELEAILLRFLVTASPGASIGAGDLRPLIPLRGRKPLFGEDLFAGRELGDLHRELDRAYLIGLFRETGGDLRKMMEIARVKRSSLYRWFRRVGLDPEELRGGK
jgi:DNA-binding NtrC family response regulator/tetratricopeptide (TPR) repeat protein